MHRKLKRLVERNYIMEKSRGKFIIVPGTYLRPEFREGYGRGVRETLAFINQCIEQGAITWQSNASKKPSS